MHSECNYLFYESNRTQLVRDAEHERLVQLTQNAAEQPAARRSWLARLAQYIGIFLAL